MAAGELEQESVQERRGTGPGVRRQRQLDEHGDAVQAGEGLQKR